MKELHKAKKHAKDKRVKFDTSKSLSEAIVRIEQLETYVDAIKNLKRNKSSMKIEARHGQGTSEAIAVAVASDWHCGAVVLKQNVNNLNEFNVGIFRTRVARFFERIVRFTKKERQDVEIKELVLFLGGDLIDGALHLDTIMSNEVSEPMKQAVICQEAIQGGLNYLKFNGDFKRITVVCCDGNHGRVSARQHWASRQGNALEWFMYYNLAQRNPEFNWVMADGIHVYLNLFKHTVRFMHGDTIAFGGVNGPYTYLNRRIYQWNQGRYADFTILGHLHWYCVGGRRWLINGSLIGHNDYAISLGGEFQPPIQAFFLYDRDRGPTINIPILV